MSAGEGRKRSDADALRQLLDYLKRSRGFDFSGYKTPSLERRIRKRMDAIGIAGYAEYLDHLEVNPEEFTELFNTILINVTGFFRDKPTWDFVASDVIPQLLQDVPEREPIRVWSAASASGEEAYSAAILLAEAVGVEEFRRRVKIYATDVDDDALTRARQARFYTDQLKPVPKELRDKYFEQAGGAWIFRPDLRRSVIFGRNDLVQDAPISRIDLLISRNALMYFTAETQARILGHFNFALKPTGFLFLGKSEMLITHTDLFTPYNLKWRVFRKVPQPGLRDRLAFLPEARDDVQEVGRYAELRRSAADLAQIAAVVVDRTGLVVSANLRARTLFGLTAADVGRPVQDLEISYRPADLRSAIGQAYEGGKVVDIGWVPWTTRDDAQVTLDIRVTPVGGNGDDSIGVVVSFTDVTDLARLESEYESSKRQLETAYEELQSTVEELETTNEELHSTNEELETTNEELQSANEELETTNEELHSANDELEAMNEEQTRRTTDLDRVNMFLEGILSNLGVGVIVVDGEAKVQVWNASSVDLWGLRHEEVEGQDLFSLEFGFPVAELRTPIGDAVRGDGDGAEGVVPAMTRRGRSFECWYRVLPLKQADGGLYGAIVLMADNASTTAVSPIS